MSEMQDLLDNPFEIIVPDPGEPLRAVIIHPRNAELQARQDSHLQFKLPEPKVKQLKKQLETLNKQLEVSNWGLIKTIIKSAREDYQRIMKRRNDIVDLKDQGEDITALAQEWNILKADFEDLAKKLPGLLNKRRELAPIARRAIQIEHRLEQHYAAVDRDRAYQRARQGLAAEAQSWHDIISDALTGMGYCYRFSFKGKEITRRVHFSEIQVGLDAVWLKVLATEKTLFGWRYVLPRNLNPKDLISEDTLLGLTIAAERQVEAVNHKHSGIWYRINRLGVTDGIVERLTYTQVMSTYPNAIHDRIPIPLGVKPGLEVFWAALTDYPHFLIAGSSGSGKSNSIKNIISTLITRQTPDDVRLMLVDLKEGTEFAIYEDRKIPHLLGNVIKTPPEFVNMLAQLEMLRIERSEKLRTVYATKLEDYNARVAEHERMPRIVVVIDEFSAIYMTNPFQSAGDNQRIANQIKALVRQLLAKARAAGIQLIISTQSPYVEILPGMDKANIALKICGRFIDKATSRAILGVGAAADIPEGIQGRMIAQTSGQMFMIQTPLVSDEDRDICIEQSTYHTEPRPLVLPALPENEDRSISFTKEELLDISLNEYGGKLIFTKIWTEHIRHSKRIGHDALYALYKEITSQPTITHNGVTYDLTRVKSGAWALKVKSYDLVVLEPGEFPQDYSETSPRLEL
jgi:hypothetical protein